VVTVIIVKNFICELILWHFNAWFSLHCIYYKLVQKHTISVQKLHVSLDSFRLRPVWMTNHPPSVLWHCWLGHQTCKNRRPYNLYCLGGDVKPCSINQSISLDFSAVGEIPVPLTVGSASHFWKQIQSWQKIGLTLSVMSMSAFISGL